MQIPTVFRRLMATAIVGVSAFVVTGCQPADTPAALPNVANSTPPPAPTKSDPAPPPGTSSGGGARMPAIGEK